MSIAVESINGVEAEQLAQLRDECRQELRAISRWWIDRVMCSNGYIGQISHDGADVYAANKGVILTTRILWFFSEAAMTETDAKLKQDLLVNAQRLYRFFAEHFIDKQHGGVYWELNEQGLVCNGRKQIYAQAFAVYALSAYYRATGDLSALEYARSVFESIEIYGRDQVNGGYLEAFSADWGELDDIRLSPKDQPSPKTMNTHLHVLEAFTGLLLAERHAGQGNEVRVDQALRDLIDVYIDRFYDPELRHLYMFLDMDWRDESDTYSYGHDIESSWLLWEAIEVLGDKSLETKYLPVVESLAQSCADEGLAPDGSVMDLYHYNTNSKSEERVWWVQAEAMVGFLNMWQISSRAAHFLRVQRIWDFTKREVIDKNDGEWHWIAKCDQEPGYNEYKVGFWKGPYHNGRALIEICRRLSAEDL